MFHKHNWDLIDKTEIPAPYTRLIEAAKEGIESQGTKMSIPMASMFFHDRVVLTFKCACGKIKVVEK